MEKGKLIVLEGACDGMGKSTQLGLLREHLEKDGKKIITHHFPTYGTYQGKPVEMYLSGEFGNKSSEISPYFIHCLYAMDRAITWRTELEPKFEEGKTILLDRYTTSSILYQSAFMDDVEEKKDFVDFVCDYEYNKLGVRVPDNIIFLHAPFDLVKKMRQARLVNDGIANDIYERDIKAMKRIYENSMFLSDYLGWDMVKCDNGNAMLPIEEIHEKVYKLVK